MSLSKKLQSLEVEVSVFREPDMGNKTTAISFLSSERTRKITSGLPLLLKPNKIK